MKTQHGRDTSADRAHARFLPVRDFWRTWRLWVGLALIGTTIALGAYLEAEGIVHDDLSVHDYAVDLRRDPITPWLIAITTLFNPLGATLLTAAAAGLFWWITRNWRPALFVAVAGLLTTVVTTILKQWFERGRPPAINHLVDVHDTSFPSGHSSGTAALAVSIVIVVFAMTSRKSARWTSVVIAAVLVGTIMSTRLYLGVHWFTDTVAGVSVGVGCGLVCNAFLRLSLKCSPPDSPPDEDSGLHLSTDPHLAVESPTAAQPTSAQPTSTPHPNSTTQGPHA